MMNILLFTENYIKGGLDTFLVLLIRHWPCKTDQITLYTNYDHPGNRTIAQKNTRTLTHVSYSALTSARLSSFFQKCKIPRFFAKCICLFAHYFLLPFQIIQCYFLLKKVDADALMIVNGGYPGGAYCIAMSIAWRMSKKRKSIHNFHNYAVPYRSLTKPIDWLVDYAVKQSTDSFISVSNSCAHSLQYRSAFNTAMLKTIYNGIDITQPDIKHKQDLRRQYGLSGEEKICLMLGSYEPRKGHQFLLKAFDQIVSDYPSISLFAFGYDPNGYRLELLKFSEGLKHADKIHLALFSDNTDAMIAEADVVVMPSQSYESFGLVLLEAMRLKKPVIATAVGGMPEVLGNRDPVGAIVDPSDVEGLARSILRAVSGSKGVEDQVERAFLRLKADFSAHRMSNLYCEQIHSCYKVSSEYHTC